MREKYEQMHENGVKSLTSSNFSLWGGVTEAMKNSFIVAYLLDLGPVSGLIENLKYAERQSGVELVLAGRDFPLHVTLQQGSGQFSDDVHMPVDVGLSAFMFDHLIAGPNVLLADEHISEFVVGRRRAVSEWMVGQSLNPSPIDILHCTIARIAALPDEANLQEFIAELLQFRGAVKRWPLLLSATGVFQGPVARLLQSS